MERRRSMGRRRRSPLVGLAPLALAGVLCGRSPLAAQMSTIHRAFSFPGDALTIVVRSDAAGRLRLLHGRVGLLEVTGAAADGAPLPLLGGPYADQLTLTTLGGGATEWVVAAPPDARVSVRLPRDTQVPTFGSPNDPLDLAWSAVDDRRTGRRWPPPPARSPPASEPSALSSVYVLEAAAAVPRSLEIEGARHLRSITVRIGEGGFRLIADRPVPLTLGAEQRIRVERERRPARLAIELPADTRTFALRLDSATALSVAGRTIQTLCASAVRQRLPRGGVWITFAMPGACAGPDAAHYRGSRSPPMEEES